MTKFVSSRFNQFADGLVNFSRSHGYPTWLIFLFILALILALHPPSWSYPVVANNKAELRGVWLTNIDSEVLFSAKETEKASVSLAETNFNTVYPTVWNWGYTLYPSAVAKKEIGISQDPEPKLKNRDILQEIILQGHKHHLAVIPWFEFGFMAPADSLLAKRHPQWLTQRRDKSKIWLEGKVHKRVWLNPLRPDVQKFITSLMVEIVRNYDIDGIQIDDHFGFPSDFGYDDFTVNLYKKEHRGKAPPTNYKNQEWVRWRANKITQYMQNLFKEIKKNNPQVIVSLSPNPQQFSLDFFLLDWAKWEQMGLVEELVLQVYRERTTDFIREIEQPEVKAAQKHIPVAVGILTGLKGRPVPLERIQTQVQEARARNLAGVSFFFYESLWDMGKESTQARQTVFQQIFATKVPRLSLANF